MRKAKIIDALHRLKKSRSKKGLTLVEVLIAMAIFSLVIGAGYSTMYSVTTTFNKRSGQVRAQNDLRLAMYWLTKDLEGTTPDKMISGVDPILYNINGIVYKRVESGNVGARKTYNIVRESASDGNITLIESVAPQDGFKILPNVNENYYSVNIVNIDRFNNDRSTELKISRKNAGVVSQSTKIAGRTAGDGTITMIFPGNTKVNPDDDTWTIDVFSGTVKSTVSINDLTINGLPAGLTARATKGVGNTIVITVSGTAIQPIDSLKHVDIVINSTAVTQTGMTKSDSIWVRIQPPVTKYQPNYYVSGTQNVTFGNNATVTGDVFISGETGTAELPNGSSFYGRVYVNKNLYVGNMIVGTPEYPVKIIVDGSVTLHNNAKINGDIYSSGSFSGTRSNVTGKVVSNSPVDIAQVKMPQLMSEQWYVDNDYTIVDNQNSSVTFKSGGKYYFRTSYSYYNSSPEVTDVIIACKGDFVIGGSGLRSGVVFAPNGRVTLSNNMIFVGSLTSQSVTLGNNSILIYNFYSTLPYIIE